MTFGEHGQSTKRELTITGFWSYPEKITFERNSIPKTQFKPFLKGIEFYHDCIRSIISDWGQHYKVKYQGHNFSKVKCKEGDKLNRD